jgi:starch-binding outer membrane protein, SusD/RagB family
MKKASLFGKLLLPLLLVASFNNSCTNLEEDLFDQLTDDNFLRTEEEFIAALGAAYTGLYFLGSHGGFHSLQEISSDEVLIPQRGGDWGDGGQWLNAHRHELKATDPNVNGAWGSLFGGVATTNRLIFQFTKLKDEGKVAAALADKFIAELRALRAMYYYWLVDMFGNVPLVTKFDVEPGFKPATETRSKVFDFVISELTDASRLLDKKKDGTTYGRMNYYAVQAILAKITLNAQVYTGTAKWDQCIAACNEIINSGLYSLEATYRNNFVTNNQVSKEFIFAIPYDEIFAKGFNLAQMTLHYESQATYNLQAQPWNGYCSLQEFYEIHDNSDPRKGNFIVGPQFASDGITRLKDTGAEGNDPDGPPLTFTPEINQHFPSAFRQAGVRIGKYEFKTGAQQELSNDWPVFRYADILLTKAEAVWRKAGKPAANAEALALVNQIRKRSLQPDFTTLTDKNLLEERGREMFYEGVRRQDQIRFGVYGNPTKFMPGSTAAKELMPIPLPQINANPNLKQNPGY